MNPQDPHPQRPYFRPTTPQQRRLLFETYQKTGDVQGACRVAHIGRRTFYYWLPRFQQGSYPALEKERSRASHRARIPPLPEAIVQEVLAYKREHPQAGYRSVAHAVRQAHPWQAVVGPTKVRQILLKAGLVSSRPLSQPQPQPPPAVHAPQLHQTVKVDLCLVPATHQAGDPLVSV